MIKVKGCFNPSIVPNSPCHNCEDRHLGCHDECEKFQKFRADMQEKKEVRTNWFKRHGMKGPNDYVE